MGNRIVVFFLLLFFAAGLVSGWDIEDLNGTYLWNAEHLQSPIIGEWTYTWGQGLSLPETSIEFDLGEMTLMMPGMGLYFIETVYMDGEDSICLLLYYVSDTEKENPYNMRVSFIDSDRIYITHDNWRRFRDRRYSPEEKWVWHRLSGPGR